MKKRILSLLLALVLCVGMLPAAAFAAEGEVPVAPPVTGEETPGGELGRAWFEVIGAQPHLGWSGLGENCTYTVYYTQDEVTDFTAATVNWMKFYDGTKAYVPLDQLDGTYTAFKIESSSGASLLFETKLVMTHEDQDIYETASVVFTTSGATVTWPRGTTYDLLLILRDDEGSAHIRLPYTDTEDGVYTLTGKDFGVYTTYKVERLSGQSANTSTQTYRMEELASGDVVVEDGGTTGGEGGETPEVTGYTLSFVYDDDLCDFSAIDWYTDVPVENGGILPINAKENRAYGQFNISNIAKGYRIASVFVNNRDMSDGFIDGAYGGCAMDITEDSTITVTLEKVPAELPDIASVTIYTGQVADKSSVPAETVTFGETLSGLHAEITFADKGSYPSYYASCLWQYSTDGGKTWTDLYVWGVRTDFNAAWSGFANIIKVDFMTLKDYQLRVMVTPKEYYSTAGEDNCIYSPVVTVNPTSGEEGGETEAPVSNLHFELDNGSPYLCWDSSLSNTWYYVYGSADEGKTWTEVGRSYIGTYVRFYNLAAGTYNAFKVEAQQDGAWVGECINTDLTLTITGQTAQKPATVAITAPIEEDGSYTVAISGLIPDNYFNFNIETRTPSDVGGLTSGSVHPKSSTEGSYYGTESASAMAQYLSDPATVCWVEELTDGVVSGNTASFAIVNHGEMLLKSVMVGPVQLAAPTDVAWGKYYYAEKNYDTGVSTIKSADYPGMISWVVADTERDHTYEIKVYKTGTAEPIYTRTWKYSVGRITHATQHDFSLSFVEELESGTYYFTVQAKGNGRTTADSALVTSDEWIYTKPTTALTAPEIQGWNGAEISWGEVDDKNVGGYLVDIYYAPSEDTPQEEWVNADGFVCYTCEGVMTSYTLWDWMFEECGTGYYYACVKAVSADVGTVNHSPFSELSEPYYYSNLVTVNTEITGEGKIVLKNEEVVAGQYMEFSVKPALGYRLSSLYYVVGEQAPCYMDAKYNGTYGLVPTESTVTIYAAFEKLSEQPGMLDASAFSVYQSNWNSQLAYREEFNSLYWDTSFVRVTLTDGDGKQVLVQESHGGYTGMNLTNPGDLKAGQYTAYITVGDANQIVPLGWCTITLLDAYPYDAYFDGQLATGASSLTVNVNVQKLSPVSLPKDLTLSLTDKYGNVVASSDQFRIVYSSKDTNGTAATGKEDSDYVNTNSSLKFTLDLTNAGLTTNVGYYLRLTAADGTQFINSNNNEIYATADPVFSNQSFDPDTLTWTADTVNLPAGTYSTYQSMWIWDSALGTSVEQKTYYEDMTVSEDGTATVVFDYWPFDSGNGGNIYRYFDYNGVSHYLSIWYYDNSGDNSGDNGGQWFRPEIAYAAYVRGYENYNNFDYMIPYDGSSTQFVTVVTPFAGSGFFEVYEPNGSLMVSSGVEDLSSFQFAVFGAATYSNYRVRVSADDESVGFNEITFQFRHGVGLGIDPDFHGDIKEDTVVFYPTAAVTEDTFKIGYLYCGEKVELPFTVNNEDGSVTVTVSSIPCGQWKPWATLEMVDEGCGETYDEPLTIGNWYFRPQSKLNASAGPKVAKLVPTVGSGYLFSAPVLYEGAAPASDVTMTVYKVADGELTYHTAVNIGTGDYTISESKLNLTGEYVFYFTLEDGTVLDVETAAFGDENVVAKGNCGQVTAEYPEGENLFWTLDKDGVLTIFGKGKMGTSDLAPSSYKYPWDAHENAVTKVVIKEGVTSLGAYAFNGYENLTSVDLAGSLGSNFGSVGGYAFASCPKLTHVTFREGYTIITSGMFEYCTALTTVVFPSTLKTFADTSFRGAGLKTVAFRGGSVNREVSWAKILSDTSGLTLFYPINSDWDEAEMNEIAPDGNWVKMQKVPNLQPDAFEADTDSTTIQAVAGAVSGTTAEIGMKNYDFYGVREQLLSANNVEDTTNAVVNVYVDVTLEKYAIGTNEKTLTLDITPRAQLVVNGERKGTPAEIKVWDEIMVTIPLPAGFAEVGEILQIIHTKDDGRKIIHDVTVQKNDEGGLYVSFANYDGFSTFAVIGSVSNSDLEVGSIRYEWDEMGQLVLRWDFPAGVKEGEYEYHISFLPEGKEDWRMVAGTGGNTYGLSCMSVGKYTAVKVETRLPGNENGPGEVQAYVTKQIPLTVKENEKTSYDPAEVTVIREAEGADAYVISISGLQPNTGTKVTFRKSWSDETGSRMDETTHGWFADNNGTIYFNERDDWFTQWLSDGLDDDTCTVMYFLQENDYSLNTDGSASITLTTYGGWTVINDYLVGNDGLLDNETYAVTDVKFYEDPNDDGDLPRLVWNGPENVSGELRYKVYFYSVGYADEKGNIRWEDCPSLMTDKPELALSRLGENAGQYTGIKVATMVNGITRGEYTTDELTLNVIAGGMGDTVPGVVVYRVSEDSNDYVAKFTGLKRETHYAFRVWNDDDCDNSSTFYNFRNTETSIDFWGDWITEAFADPTDDRHIHYSLKEIAAVLSEDETHVDLTIAEVVYAYDPVYEEMPTYASEEVEVTNIRFTVENGVPYLRWDAPEKALKGLTYHVMFDYKNADGENWRRGWPVDGLRTELHNMEPAVYTTVRVISELNGMEVAEVAAKLTLSVVETTGSEAKLTIWDNTDPNEDDRFLFSGLNPNSSFRFEAIQDKNNPNGPSFDNDLRADANGACENRNGAWWVNEYSSNGVYRIVEKTAVLDENGNLTIANVSTDLRDVAAAIAVPAAPKADDVTVKEDLNLNKEQADEVTEAASGVTVDLVHENVEIDTKGIVDETTGEEIDTTREDISVKTEVALKIEVTDYQIPVADEETGEIIGDTTTMVLDITPVATVTVSKETVNEETGTPEFEVIATKEGAEVNTVGTPVVVTIPLPRNFLDAAGWTLYVVHTKDDGDEFTHRVDVQGDDETGYFISFVNTEGFSTFTVTGKAVELTYTDGDGAVQTETFGDLQSALNEAQNRLNNDGADVTVKLMLDGLEENYVVVPVGVTLDLNGKTLNANYVVAFNGTHVIGDGLLKCENVSLNENNSWLPYWVEAEEGYRFISAEDQGIYAVSGVNKNGTNATQMQYMFRLSEAMREITKDGAENDKLEVLIEVSWIVASTQREQTLTFTYKENELALHTNKNYLYVTLTGLGNFDDLSVHATIVSETDVRVEAPAKYHADYLPSNE